jgi:predicted acylesterase/phospholipase RssA
MTAAAKTNRAGKPTCLSLGSGGSRGVVMLGALSTLQRTGWLDNITRYYGSSVGSVIATGLCLGTPCSVLKKRVENNPIVLDTAPEHVIRNAAKFGMHNPNSLVRFIKKVTRAGKKTFTDVYNQTNKDLVIVVSNVSTGTVEHWDRHSHPNTKIVKALRLSCRIPFVFTHGQHDGHIYIDGGVGEPVPYTTTPMSTLAISFDDHVDSMTSIVEYARAMVNVATKKQPVRWHIDLDAEDLSPFEFAMDRNTVQQAYALGERQGGLFVKKNI